jgi:hypothetical protein
MCGENDKTPAFTLLQRGSECRMTKEGRTNPDALGFSLRFFGLSFFG